MTQTGMDLTVARGLDEASRAELLGALARLRERGGLMNRVAEALGGALGGVMGRARWLPGMLRVPGAAAMQRVVEVTLRRAFDLAIVRLGNEAEQRRSRRFANPLVIASGALGGALGFVGFLPDTAVTTLAILREVARIAQEQGESLDDPQTRAACLQVLGLASGPDAGEEMGYFSARMVLQGRPMALLMKEVASRFGMTLSQKFALQAVPLVGALGGAAVNAAFLAQFRQLALAHFTVRRLERVWGKEAVSQAAEDERQR